MIDDLLGRGTAELVTIAENDAWFGLSATVDADARRTLLQERIAFVHSGAVELSVEPVIAPPVEAAGEVNSSRDHAH
jgi:hypothetical protein